MLRRLIHISLNPFFQALVVAGLIILFVPFGLKKYNAEQAEMSTNFNKTQFVFADLDHDGKSERIQTLFNFAGNVGIAIRAGNATLGQWNFRGVYQPDCPRIMMGDYNNNGLDEIYIFTLASDSVMLHAMEYSSKPSFFIRDRFITKIGKSLKDPDHFIIPGNIADMNGDGSGDLVFGISTGFSKQPRNVYIYDVLNDSLRKSPQSGTYIDHLLLFDLDCDGFEEILLNTYASGNFNEEPFPFTDTSSWMIVLDHDLNFLFQPVEFPGQTGSLEILPLKTKNGETVILGKYLHASTSGYPGKIFLADLKGNFLNERIIKVNDILFNMDLLTQYESKGRKCYNWSRNRCRFF